MERIKNLVRQYDEADKEYFEASVLVPHRFSNADRDKLLEVREELYKKLYEDYGVTRNNWGDLLMPDGTLLEMEE